MDLRIGNNGYAAAAAGIGQAAEAAKAAETAGARRMAGGGFTVTELPERGAVDALETMQVPESALRRDDALGKLVNEAFSLPPPPMPNFID